MATLPTDLYDAPAEDEQSGALAFLERVSQATGDISEMFTAEQLTTLGADVVRDYEADLSGRADWETIVTQALEDAAQGERELAANLPAYRQSHVNFPILTVAAQQFNARAYPAICKSGNMVRVKIIGSDKGRPEIGPDGQPVMQPDPNAPTPQPGMMGEPGIGHNGGPAMVPVWATEPGSKTRRASRVSDYLNVYLEYRMKGWEEDTDAMLQQLAIVGCGFRKLWWANGRQHAAYVPALDLVVPIKAKSLDTTPRTTEIMRDVYPYQIRQRQLAGEYRADVVFTTIDADEEAPRVFLEQHLLRDMDGDGVDEPYIVTVDKESSQVMKIEANFSPSDVHLDENDQPIEVKRGRFYVKYGFLPNPKGEFYDIGFGHLLNQLGDVIDTTINQMFDAGHAQIAGGGFLASGVRLQGNGQSNTMRWMPGEYKTVNVTGQALRDGIYERTFPGPSPIMMNLLELVLGAAKDITSVKDVVTGEASNQGQVGTTLALIEQGLAVFTAIYKRIYLALGNEFGLIYENLGKFGGEEAAADYDKVLDDPQADFAKDFSEDDCDIKPVADPSSVTKMQRVAKAQALLAFKGQGLNDMAINRRALEALDIEDIDELMPPEKAPPDPVAVANLQKLESETKRNNAQADYYEAQAAQKGAEIGHKLGEAEGGADAGNKGRLPDVEGSPGDGFGLPGAGDGGAGPAAGMEPSLMGDGAEQPGIALGTEDAGGGIPVPA